MEFNQQKDEEFVFDLQDLFYEVISKIGIIVVAGIVAAVLALGYTKIVIKPQYQSITKMYVLAQENTSTLTNVDLQTSTLLTKDYAELIKSRTVLEKVIDELGLNMKYEGLLGKIEVVTTSETRIMTIKVRDENPELARRIANTIREKSAEHIKRVMNSEDVTVVDEANLPEKPFSPNVKKNVMMGGMAGAILALAFVVIRYLSNDTITTPEDIEKYLKLSTLGVIPIQKDVKQQKTQKKPQTKPSKRR